MLKRSFFTIFLLFFALSFGYPVGYFVLGGKDSVSKTKVIDNSKIVNANTGNGTGVYVINLDRSKERYDYIKNSIVDLGLVFTRISAVDGSTINETQIAEKVDIESYRSFFGFAPNRGTIGCYMSHTKVWESFLNSNLKYAVIFEDDVSFDPNKLKETISDLEKNKKLWDIVTFEISHRGFPLTIKKFQNDEHLVVYLNEITHTGCYMINRKAAEALLAKAFPMKMPVDHYFTRAWEFDLKFTGIENPRLVHQTFGESEITKTKRVDEEKIDFFASLARRLYKLQSYTIRFFYNLKLYFTSGRS